MLICQHCGCGRATRPRHLCWSCYYRPGVRDLYPANSKFGRRGPGAYRRTARPAGFPTGATPGSLEKILVMSQRAELGQGLWHPDDATFEEAPRLARVG